MNEHQRRADRCDPSRPDEAADVEVFRIVEMHPLEAARALRHADRTCTSSERLVLAHEMAREALVHAQGPAWPERRQNALRTAVLALDRVLGAN